MLEDARAWGLAFRVIGTVISALLVIWGLLPLSAGSFDEGSVVLVVGGTVGAVVCVRFFAVAAFVLRLWQSTAGRILLIAVAAIAAALVILFVVVSVMMVNANHNEPADDATVIVLGAGIREDRPSRILRGRLDATVAYLQAHPQAMCVVSGGQGPDEICSEASVMQTYLINAGIAPERIYAEDQSTSTYENIQFSKRILEQNGLSTAVAVVTQEFHQYRAQQFAKAAGFTEVGAVTARTPWYLLGNYWIRDFAGICHMVLLGT